MERRFEWLWDKYKEGAREKFEEVCRHVYEKEYSDAEVNRVRIHQGDGGIDVCMGYSDRFIVAQCKFFRDSIGDSQKGQIRKSFNSVDKKEITEWILCIPIIMSNQEAAWWRRWKREKEIEFDIKIKLHDEDDLIGLLKKHDLYDEYFNTVRLDKNFVEEVVGNNEKKIIHDRLYPLISAIAGVDYDMYDIVLQVDTLTDLKVHRMFKASDLLNDLNELAQLYSLHAEGNNLYGKQLRDEKKIAEETELRKKIVNGFSELNL